MISEQLGTFQAIGDRVEHGKFQMVAKSKGNRV